jgi:hypothetical protein
MSGSEARFRALYLEMVDSTAMIRALLAGISVEEARVKPNAESWSILETLCHLHDEECRDFRVRLDAILNRPEADWEPIDPAGWVKSRRYNEQDLNEVKERFFTERSRSLDWLKGQEGASWDASHESISGSMSAGDMLASWVAHDNLAIRQLTELRRARLERISAPWNLGYAGDW